MEWKLAEAKNRLSEVVNRARDEGPQVIRRRNDAFVVLTLDHYHRLVGHEPSFRDLLLAGPGLDADAWAELDLERDRSGMREFDFLGDEAE